MKGKLLILMVLASACGCGRVGVGDVTGRITLDGAPLDGVAMLFWPVDGSGEGCGAITHGDGTFAVRMEGSPTVRPGQFRVVIQDPRNMPAFGTTAIQVSPRTPFQYGDRAQSPLLADLYEGANELPPFELRTGP